MWLSSTVFWRRVHSIGLGKYRKAEEPDLSVALASCWVEERGCKRVLVLLIGASVYPFPGVHGSILVRSTDWDTGHLRAEQWWVRFSSCDSGHDLGSETLFFPIVLVHFIHKIVCNSSHGLWRLSINLYSIFSFHCLSHFKLQDLYRIYTFSFSLF